MSESVPTCGWCEASAVTDVVVVPGRVRRKTKPVCETHAKHFEDQGVLTTRLEVERKLESERKRSAWKKRQGWR